MKTIESKQNKFIKWVKKLIDDPKYRKENKSFCIEGKKNIETLTRYISPTYLIVNDTFLSKNQKNLKKFYGSLILVPNALFNYLSTLKSPEGIMAIFSIQENKVEIKKEKNYIALVDVQNPNNLGAIIRSSLAFDIDGIFLINSHVDLFNQEVLRSSCGYIYDMPITFYNNFDYFFSEIKTKGISLIATALTKDSIDLKKMKKFKSNCFIFGNEGSGLNEKIISKCDNVIKIEMNQKVESLNINVAVAVIAYYLKINENN